MGRLPFTVVFNDDSSSEEEKEQTHVKSERLQLRAAMEASSRDAEKKEKEKAGRKRPRKEAALKQEKKPKVEKKKEKETRREKQKSRSKAERKASAEAEKPQDGTTEGEEKAVDSRDKKAVSMEEEPQAHGRKRRAISNASDNGVRAQAEQQKEDTKQEDAPEAAKATRNSQSDGNTSEPTRRRLKRPSSAMTNASKKDGDDAKTPAEANERVKVKKHKFSDQLRSRKPPAEKRGKRELPAKAASLDDYLKEEASRAREPETVRAPVKKSEKKRPAPQSLNEYLDATKDKKRPKDLNGRHEGKHGVAKEAADSEKTEAREEWASGNRPKFKSSDGEQADDSRKLETNKDDEIVENSEQPTENGSVDRSEHTEEDEPKVNQVTPQQDVISTVVASEAPVSQDDSAPTLESSSHVAAVSPTKSEDQCSNVQNDSSSSKAPVDSEAPQPSLNGLDDDEEEGAVSDQEPVPVAVETQASQTVSESSETPAEPVVDPMSFVIPKKRVVRDLSKNESSDMTSLSSARTTTVSNGDAGVPRMSPSASPSAAEITPVNVVEETKKTPRTKGVVPPTMPHLSNDEKHYMRLAKKSNSLLKPAAMIVSRDKSLKPHMLSAFGNISDRYGVIVDGKPLHEEKKRMWCPTRKEIKKSGNPPAFFGVNMDAPLHGVDKTAENVETQDTDIKKSAPIPCYERLEFERPEEREWYQQQFYGTKFIPQMLRERVTLVMHNARYVRRATGLLFNAQRDKEEYMEQLEERYKVKDRKPRCDILQKNWQQLVNGRVAFVFLHYKTREDAVAARAQYKDDDGRALTFKGESRNADHPSGNGRAGSTPIRMSPSPPPGPSHRPRSPRRPPHEDRDWNRRDRRPSFNAYDGRMNGRYGPGQHPRSPGGQPPRRRSRSRSWSRPQPLHPDSQRVYPGDRPHADDNRSSQSSNPEASQTSHHSQDPTGISQDSSLEEGETMGKDHTHGGDQKAGWSNGERPSSNHDRRSRSRSRSRPRMRDNKDHPHGGHRGYDERSRGPHPMDRGRGRSQPPHHYWGDRGDRRHMNERDRHHSGDHFHRPSHPHDQRPSDRRPGPHDDYHRRQRDEEFRRGRFQNDMRDYH